jgi:23S rRNA pseudouridine2605 synthase
MKPSQRQRRQPGAGLARALSKLGFCSRSRAIELVLAGRVRLNGTVRTAPGWPVDLRRDRFEIDDQPIESADKVYLMLNKPRGLVTTADDEQGRATVFECFGRGHLPFIAPVGRLDQASEGLLLFTNDTQWAARITDPVSGLEKIYHVQVDGQVEDGVIQRLADGLNVDGEFLAVRRAKLLRHGSRTSWLELVLDEGKNRHVRRLLRGFGFEVLRLVRVAIGPLRLGGLAKGQYRHLSAEEVRELTGKRRTK